MPAFKLVTAIPPRGDQPKASEPLSAGILHGERFQTLLGVTGSGKTFTMANVVARVRKPMLVIAHNKTLAEAVEVTAAREHKTGRPPDS